MYLTLIHKYNLTHVLQVKKKNEETLQKNLKVLLLI